MFDACLIDVWSVIGACLINVWLVSLSILGPNLLLLHKIKDSSLAIHLSCPTGVAKHKTSKMQQMLNLIEVVAEVD